jgi:ribosomal protein S18 acetylase RimI-like enzyme
VEIERLGPHDVQRVLDASSLLDDPARPDWTLRFLTSEGHHLLVATVDGVDVGFVTGVEMTHPDKGTEMLLYELGVDEAHQRRGIGRALTEALADLARAAGCYGMWVATESDNEAALATYAAAGAAPPEPGVTLAWTFDQE